MFPSDHHFANETRFRRKVRQICAAAGERRDRIVVVGAPPSHPETAYGWIEPAEAPGAGLRKVTRFWEKPEVDLARQLVAKRRLWNTFIMIGSAAAFLNMIAEAVPDLFHAMNSRRDRIAEVYPALPQLDFSRHVLARNADRLLTTTLGDVGWNDLGEPHRAREVMSAGGRFEGYGVAGAKEGLPACHANRCRFKATASAIL